MLSRYTIAETIPLCVTDSVCVILYDNNIYNRGRGGVGSDSLISVPSILQPLQSVEVFL